MIEKMGILPVPPKTGNVSMDTKSHVTIYVSTIRASTEQAR
jgi:hypothetical protein